MTMVQTVLTEHIPAHQLLSWPGGVLTRALWALLSRPSWSGHYSLGQSPGKPLWSHQHQAVEHSSARNTALCIPDSPQILSELPVLPLFDHDQHGNGVLWSIPALAVLLLVLWYKNKVAWVSCQQPLCNFHNWPHKSLFIKLLKFCFKRKMSHIGWDSSKYCKL